MNELLDRIERELESALRRRNARARRRRRVAATAAGALAALLLAGVAAASVAGVPTPIERLLAGAGPEGRRAGTPRVDLVLTDPGGLRWTATAYLARNGMWSGTAAPAGLRDPLPSVGGASGFVIADNLLEGPLAGVRLDVVRASGRLHYLFWGTVDARVRVVSVELGGERRDAVLSPSSLDIPVERPRCSRPAQPGEVCLTEAGARRADRMPAEVSVRLYAAAFTPDLLAGSTTAVATLAITLDDHTTTTQQSARLCVSPKCEFRIPAAG